LLAKRLTDWLAGLCMGHEQYAVTYVDEHAEEAAYLKREGQVKITYANGDTFEGTIGAGLVKQGEGTYTWCQRGDDGEGALAAVASAFICQGRRPH